MEKQTELDTKVDVIRRILNDNMGDWGTELFRCEFLRVLFVVVVNGDYSPIQNGLIYSFWKMHRSERVMKMRVLDMPVLSMENAWDILRELNLGEFSLPDDMVEAIKYRNLCHFLFGQR